MRTDQAKKIRLLHLLEALGHAPLYAKGTDAWYLSPFRQERDPSFKVNTQWNSWYDFGEGRGGNVLDFVMAYFRLSTIREALAELDRFEGLRDTVEPLPLFPSAPVTPSPPVEAHRTAAAAQPAAESPGITLQKVRPLQNPALIQYLEARAIPVSAARSYVQEAYYTVPGRERTFYALAFPSASGGYELRNKYFKGVSGAKDISRLTGQENGIAAVFEGFMDFLSWFTYEDMAHLPGPVIVLNSTALKDRAVVALRDMGIGTVHLYLDNDDTGRRLTGELQAALGELTVVDRSDLYGEHKDFNAFLQALPRRRGIEKRG